MITVAITLQLPVTTYNLFWGDHYVLDINVKVFKIQFSIVVFKLYQMFFFYWQAAHTLNVNLAIFPNCPSNDLDVV